MSFSTKTRIKTIEFESLPDGRVNTVQAARYLGLRPRTLESLRSRGRGPKYAKLGRIFYFVDDLDKWVKTRVVEPADSGPNDPGI